ncbi:MAG TPA: hypothetical protein VMT95_11650 [Candidatus Binatia bacterium]|nr:hypothetical protein [Candidatus Binatia bacterium]
MDTSTDLTPQQIGSYWAVPTIDSTANSQVEIQVSVAVSPSDTLKGSDVTTQAMSNATALTQLSGPDQSSLLPTAQTRAVTAFAVFTFDNPQNLAVTSIVVGVCGQTATFGTPPDSSPMVA